MIQKHSCNDGDIATYLTQTEKYPWLLKDEITEGMTSFLDKQNTQDLLTSRIKSQKFPMI